MIADLLGLFAFPAAHLAAAIAFVAAFMIACEYTRIGLMLVGPRSRAVHLAAGLVTTVLQPAALAAGLWIGVAADASRAGLLFGLNAAMFIVWYGAGESTRLVRHDTGGADLGFMGLCGVIVAIVGALAVVVH